MDEQTLQLLSNLSECSPEQLEQVTKALDDAFDDLAGDESKKPTPQEAASMTELVEAREGVAAEQARRVEADAAAQQQAEELRSRMKLVRGDGTDDAGEVAPVEDADEEGKPKAAKPAEGDEAAPEGEAAPIAASGQRIARMAAQGRPGASPNGTAPRTGLTLVASGSTRGTYGPDHVFEEPEELGLAMYEQLTRMSKSANGRGGEPAIVASARYEFPEELRLTRDPSRNLAIMTRATRQHAERQALAASGGIPGPPAVDYSIPVWSSADRPLRDGLTSVQADRGALMYVTPPSFGLLAGATAVWTEATDASPGETVKPVVSIGANSLVTVYVDAVATRIGAGNMEGRFSPEWVAANTELALAAAAQIQELNLLSHIDAAATAVTAAKILGTSRDLLTQAELMTAAYRDRFRLADSQAFTAIFPRWTKGLFRVDIARELAHDTSGIDVRAVTDAQIDNWLGARGITPIWMYDGISGQTFSAQSAGALNTWPTTVVWRLFAEDVWVHLDGGSLDLGVVRDSTLDATNDYETFSEIFETVANRGPAASTFKITSTVLSDGSSSATVTPTTSEG